MARQGAMGVEDFIRNKVSKIRHWKLTNLGKKRPKWGFEFTVMTYNILSQTAVDCHLYLYRNCNEQFLSEEYRISKIMPEILKSRSDVVCLQEVEQHLYDHRIKRVFESNGFQSIFKKRTGNKTDGCAILWRRTKFNLLRHQEVKFKSKGSEFLNRDNVGLIAVLKPKHPLATQTQLHVATTHLIFNPRRGDVKFCQLRLLLAELEKSAFKNMSETGRAYHPTILCGDFNFEPHSPLYKFVETGRLDLTGLLAGNMSGQLEGKGKGSLMDSSQLSLDKLGIDQSGRFREGFTNSTDELVNGLTQQKAERCSSEHLSSYMHLLKEMQQSKASTSRVPSNGASSSSDCTPKFDDEESGASSSSDESESSGPQQFYHDFNFVPTYKYYQKDKKSFPITSMTGYDVNTVDHIFYNVKEKSERCFAEDALKLCGYYTLPRADDLKDVGLPNAFLGSDHFSLMSKFVISFKT